MLCYLLQTIEHNVYEAYSHNAALAAPYNYRWMVHVSRPELHRELLELTASRSGRLALGPNKETLSRATMRVSIS